MINYANLKAGDILSESQFYRVESLNGDIANLKNDKGNVYRIGRQIVEQDMHSASQFEKTEKVTQTEMIILAKSHARMAMTITFRKKIDVNSTAKTLSEAVTKLVENSTLKELESILLKALKPTLKNAVEGELREIAGRHYGQFDEFGRLRFIDMEQEGVATDEFDKRQRLVDLRTISQLIVNQVRYQLK